jgi:hypothetical protein
VFHELADRGCDFVGQLDGEVGDVLVEWGRAVAEANQRGDEGIDFDDPAGVGEQLARGFPLRRLLATFIYAP